MRHSGYIDQKVYSLFALNIIEIVSTLTGSRRGVAKVVELLKKYTERILSYA